VIGVGEQPPGALVAGVLNARIHDEKLRECDPSVVCVLVSQLIERRIEAGDIVRGQSLDVNWSMLTRALIDAASQCAPARVSSGRKKGGGKWRPW
jgi:hypothetical protein